MNCAYRIGLICALLLLLVGGLCHRAEARRVYFSPEMRSCLNDITADIYNDKFDSAGMKIDSLAQVDSSRIYAFLFYSILYQSRMMAAESDSLEAEFYAALDSLQNRAEAMLETGSDSVIAYYLLGHQFAFRSLHDGRAGHTWSAIKKGLKARNAYSDGYKMDSAFYDIGLGLGSYRYWKSVKTKAINWTPLFKSEKKDGIALLRLAADSSEISRDAARASLVWVYINEERFGEAIRLADDMRRRYPEGLTFLWALAEAYYKLKDYPQAAKNYSEILDRLRLDPGNWYNMIEVSYYLVDCYEQMEQKVTDVYSEDICALKAMITGAAIPEETRDRQSKKLKSIRKACE